MVERAVVIRAALLAGLAAAGCRAPQSDNVTLQGADPSDGSWTSYGLTYAEQRHSPLRQIDEESVARLGLAWSLDLGTLRGLEATPLMQDGILYVTGAWSVVYAVDARSGQVIWTYDPKVPKEHAKFACCDVVNRGAALYRDRVYFGTLDGRLIALDARTGAPVWQVATTPRGTAYTITGAPRVANGRVLIGNGGAEYGVRGYVSAYDALTGQLEWRTYFVPGDPSKPFESEALRRAAATWSGEWWKAGGGGTAWDAIVYDPGLDLVFVGTGNGSPWYRRLRSKEGGDNLYLSSIVALRASDGEMVWHYQTTPGDNWDYTATQPLMLADLDIGGRRRRVIMQAPKNGFFYVLDRETGDLLSARAYGHMTWANGIDSTGRPIIVSEAMDMKAATIVSPGPWGAHNWYPMSFNPATGLVYFAVQDAPFLHVVNDRWAYKASDQNLGRDRSYTGPALVEISKLPISGHLVAWDPVGQREVWRAEHPVFASGGTLSTAGNLVFQGRSDGMFRAYRATDGKPLWEFDAGVGIAAPPMTFALGDTQYVAVLSGWGGTDVLVNGPNNRGTHVGPGSLLAFSLGGSATLPPYQRVVPPIQMPTFSLGASPGDITAGFALYGQYCARCHGLNVVSGGSVPDLRYATAATHGMFEQIVRGGARSALGMPSFADDLTPAQVRAVQAYVLDRAKQSARAVVSR